MNRSLWILALFAGSFVGCRSEDLVSTSLQKVPLAPVASRDAHGRARTLMDEKPRDAALPGDTTPEAAARLHLLRHETPLGVGEEGLEALVPIGEHDLPGGGHIVQFRQKLNGVPVFMSRANVVMDEQLNLVSITCQLAPVSTPAKFSLAEEEAREIVIAAHGGVTALDEPITTDALSPAPREPAANKTRLASARVLESVVTKVLYHADDDSLIPAYHVEVLLRLPNGDNRGYGEVVDARDGSSLWTADLTAYETFKYRVWADGNHVPADGPLMDASPLPGATMTRERPVLVGPALMIMDGFNKSKDPWLDATATTTNGNNVSAYSDRNESQESFRVRNDGFNQGVDVRADVTAPRTFDRRYDTKVKPNQTNEQIKAAVTQVFYTANWLHDYWYDSGFNEASGNAQRSNLGRGGVEGDPLLTEAQDAADHGASTNANMSTLQDGVSPRMQMYVWQGIPNRAFATDPPVMFEDELGSASYGQQMFDTAGDLVLVNDGSTQIMADPTGLNPSMTPGTTTDGCQRFSGVDGKIAVVDRGACTFITKIRNATTANAKAVIVIDNAPGHIAPSPSSDGDGDDITIPVLTLSYEDGMKLKAALPAAKAMRFYRGPETMRDGTIDNTVVAHEWGHYLHHRLVDCGRTSCNGMSEGWGDFTALMMVIRDGDTFPGQVFALSQYAGGGISQYSSYFGVRRAPYSVEMNKNPFTFKHVREASKLPTGVPLAPSSPDMNEAHNVGEIWAEMMYEVYVNVLNVGRESGRSFAECQRRMADYVVAGMKAAPPEPTFTEQRDAIISAARAMAQSDTSRASDVTAIAQGFAKRGLGAGAVAPSNRSTTLNEAVESFNAQ